MKNLNDIAKRIGYIFEPSNKVEMKSLQNEFEQIKENLKIEHKKCLVEFVQFIFNKYPILKTFDLNFTASFGEDGMHSNWSGGEVMEITLALDLITKKDIDAVLERTIEQLNDEFNTGSDIIPFCVMIVTFLFSREEKRL